MVVYYVRTDTSGVCMKNFVRKAMRCNVRACSQKKQKIELKQDTYSVESYFT